MIITSTCSTVNKSFFKDTTANYHFRKSPSDEFFRNPSKSFWLARMIQNWSIQVFIGLLGILLGFYTLDCRQISTIETLRYLEGKEVGGVKCQGVYLSSDDMTRLTYRMSNAHSLYILNGKQIRLPDLLLVSKWIQLLDPLLALPCNILLCLTQTV